MSFEKSLDKSESQVYNYRVKSKNKIFFGGTMFDFSSLSVSSVVSAPALSTAQIQARLKEMAVAQVFPQGVAEMVQTDTAKFAIPFDFEGAIHWVEVSFVAKKDDFDPAKAEHEFQVKQYNAMKREEEKASKRAEKAKAVANDK